MAISKTKILQKNHTDLYKLKCETQKKLLTVTGKTKIFYEDRLNFIIAEHKRRQQETWEKKWQERQRRIRSYNDSFTN